MIKVGNLYMDVAGYPYIITGLCLNTKMYVLIQYLDSDKVSLIPKSYVYHSTLLSEVE